MAGLVYLVVFMLIFAIILVFVFKIINDFDAQIQSDADMPPEAKLISNRMTYDIKVFDWIWLFALLIYSLSVTISAFFVRSHPIVFFFLLIGLIAYILAVGIFGELFYQITSETELNAFNAAFPIINFIMTKFPFYIFILSMVIAIVWVSKGGE